MNKLSEYIQCMSKEKCFRSPSLIGQKIELDILTLSKITNGAYHGVKYVYWALGITGQCHEIFCFRFFHESSSP
jgi:hypothetical protein